MSSSLAAKVEVTLALLRSAVSAHAPAVFTTSLGVEDMVLLDLIDRAALVVDVVTLETGRLPEPTLELLDRAREHYGRPIRALYPDAQALEAFVTAQGVNAFYRSIELRKRCCEIRKTEPLRRGLAGKGVWITGLRREQSVTRADLPALEFDAGQGLMKANPLIDWTSADVWAYVREHSVPTNPMHQQGYPSIGCAPCTRAITAGEDERAGRWWWEQPETRECGLHMSPDGRLVRSAPAPDSMPAAR